MSDSQEMRRRGLRRFRPVVGEALETRDVPAHLGAGVGAEVVHALKVTPKATVNPLANWNKAAGWNWIAGRWSVSGTVLGNPGGLPSQVRFAAGRTGVSIAAVSGRTTGPYQVVVRFGTDGVPSLVLSQVTPGMNLPTTVLRGTSATANSVTFTGRVALPGAGTYPVTVTLTHVGNTFQIRGTAQVGLAPLSVLSYNGQKLGR